MVNGLYATSAGVGGLTIIESCKTHSETKFSLELTGQQGDVMKESMSCAKTVAWNLIPDDIKKKIIDLDSYCRFKDQKGKIFTQYNSRTGNELNAGSGKAKIIEGESKWKNLIGAECLYSIRYLEDRTFSIRKCNAILAR